MPGTPDELAAQKRSLRRLLVERREVWLSQTSEDERAAYVASIWSQVESSEAFRSARTILLYASLPDEVPTEDILKRWSHPTVPDSASPVIPDSASRVLPDSASLAVPDSASPVMPDSIGHPWVAKTLVLPLVEGECLRLKAYRPDAVQPGYQGILEPLPSCPDVAPESIDLAIVPGRAFTADGARKGFL